MNKIKVTEAFYSIQGEGRFVGRPSVFLRTYGCNFSCRGFNMPKGQLTDEPERIIASVDLDSIKSINELPLSNTGCDSYVSWHPKLKHLSKLYTIDELTEHLVSLTPNRSFDGIDLVITGGEPLLGWQKAYPALVQALRSHGLKSVTFETNGTQKITEELANYIQDTSMSIEWHFSVSAKLPVSGEKWEDAIKPEIVGTYSFYDDAVVDLKFVVDPDRKDSVDYVKLAIETLKPVINGSVYLMSEGGTTETYNAKKTRTAQMAMELGYCYSPRLQAVLFANDWGT